MNRNDSRLFTGKNKGDFPTKYWAIVVNQTMAEYAGKATLKKQTSQKT